MAELYKAAQLPGMVQPRERRRSRMSSARRREELQGYLFITPWILGFLFFTLGPMLASLYLGFARYDVITPPRWIGLTNYRYALFQDRLFWLSLRRTLTWVLISVPLGVTGSLLAAMLLNQKITGTSVWRLCFFLPSLTPLVAAALLWRWILQPDIGVINSLLYSWFGIKGPPWLGSVDWALPSLIIIALWSGIGGSRMLIFLAGLQGIPQEMYEAADIDGANRVQKALHITLPLVSPTLFLNLLLGMIGAFKVFSMAFVATQGGPAYATYFYALHIYYMAFGSGDMGYGSTLAWIFFVIVLALTILQINASRRWVYYEAERI